MSQSIKFPINPQQNNKYSIANGQISTAKMISPANPKQEVML